LDEADDEVEAAVGPFIGGAVFGEEVGEGFPEVAFAVVRFEVEAGVGRVEFVLDGPGDLVGGDGIDVADVFDGAAPAVSGDGLDGAVVVGFDGADEDAESLPFAEDDGSGGGEGLAVDGGGEAVGAFLPVAAGGAGGAEELDGGYGGGVRAGASRVTSAPLRSMTRRVFSGSTVTGMLRKARMAVSLPAT
jgi:hypothetical protein